MDRRPDPPAARHRDVAAFGDRAPGYDEGWRGRMHRDIVERTLDIALAVAPAPRRVLDVGCGTGLLLRLLADRLPDAETFTGIDAAVGMVDSARRRATAEPRLSITLGVAEQLPYDDGSFDLVVSSTSFDHWVDQRAGLAECARVTVTGGRLVLTDLFSWWMVPLVVARRDRVRTVSKATRLLREVGYHSLEWHRSYATVIRTVTAVKQP